MKKLFLLLFGLVAASYAFAVTPADPTNVTWYDCGDESGHSYLTFTLPTVDVDGNPLDIEMMGYRIYTDDDQIVSFNSAVYDNVWGTTTDIYYYNWVAGSDLQSGGVYFYRTNADGYERFFNYRIGIQVFYLNSNFTIGDVSNIVYTELETQLPKPKNPEINEWLDFAGGFSQLGITIAQTIMTGEPVADDYTVEKEFNDIEGDYTVLDPAKVTYSIFTDDDQLFVFTPEDYPYDFTEAVTEIPFNYEGMEFDMWTAHFPNHSNITPGMDRFFNWRIGLRTNYRDGENMSCSDIIYMEVYPQLQEAKDVTPTSFLADWSCDAENTFILNNFQGGGGYDLYVINKATQDTIVIKDVEPTNWSADEYGNTFPLPGATCTVEGLTPGATYEFYVVARKNEGVIVFPSVVREVTLPQEGHGYELGDVNHDNAVNIADLTELVDSLLGAEGDICTICADVNPDGEINIADVAALIDMLLGAN